MKPLLSTNSSWHKKLSPKRGDWYSEVQSILKEFQINISEEEIKVTKVNHFKRLVKQKAIKTGINYLNSKQIKGGKGS